MMNNLQEQILEEEREEFKIDSLEGATWAFRKLRAINEKESEYKAIAEQEITKVQTWLESVIKPLGNDKAYFEGVLSQYYKAEREKDKKFKLSTPYGKVAARETDKYYYEDEQAIMDYCNMNKVDCIRVKEELDKASFKKVCKGGVNLETGEVVPGVRVEKELSITVKVEWLWFMKN